MSNQPAAGKARERASKQAAERPEIERRTEQTGIYVTKVARATTDVGMRELCGEINKMVEKARSREVALSQLDHHAKSILDKNGVHFNENGIPIVGSKASPIVKDAQTALIYLKAYQDNKTTMTPEQSFMAGWELRGLADKLINRAFEPVVKAGRGKKNMIVWRGQYVKASRLERRMLKVLSDEPEMPIKDFYQKCWRESYKRSELGKVYKATCNLNKNLSEHNWAVEIKYNIVFLARS